MDRVPKRSDDIYKEIENFEDYELTNCIAYEMAIRNDEFISIMRETKLYNILKYKRKEYSIDDLIEIIDFLVKESDSIKELSNMFALNITGHLIYLLDKKQFFLNKNKIGYMINGKIKSDNIFLKQINKKPDLIQSLYFRYSRPGVSLKSANKVSINIDLSLSESEIVSQVLNIKNEYDKDSLLIESPLSENVKLLMDRRTKKIDKEKLADMFFIYDGNKIGMKKAQLINSLNYYYYDKSIKTSNFDNKTLNKYLDMVKEYIDDSKYLYLKL